MEEALFGPLKARANGSKPGRQAAPTAASPGKVAAAGGLPGAKVDSLALTRAQLERMMKVRGMGPVGLPRSVSF